LQVRKATFKLRNPFFGAAFATQPYSGIVGKPGLEDMPMSGICLQGQFQLIL
jgi:hypothetical protein